MSVNQFGVRETLCWDCARSAGGLGCPWVDGEPPRPVPGWQVERLKRSCHKQMDAAYVVTSCPLFCREAAPYARMNTDEWGKLTREAGRLRRSCGHR